MISGIYLCTIILENTFFFYRVILENILFNNFSSLKNALLNCKDDFFYQ